MSTPGPFPSSIDLSLIDPSLISPVMPIPPEVFYGTPPGTSGSIPSSGNNSLRPPLHELQRSSRSLADPSRPPSPALEAKKGKKREEFTLKDVDQLLHMTIEVNLYAAPRNSIGEAWKDVVRKSEGSSPEVELPESLQECTLPCSLAALGGRFKETLKHRWKAIWRSPPERTDG